ncbi:MAG TPA: redoxin domain-containing protein [Candidatus Xenobia bacterium]|nr:redoxin domain-containing protein [Candidatus Xenobia bacterium]
MSSRFIQSRMKNLMVVLVMAALCAPPALGTGKDVRPRIAPELPKKGWLNTPAEEPLQLSELRGKVVLVEFWTFACWNCKNVLPYVKAWHEKYGPQGLVVIGVHAPELEHERKLENVKKAIRKQGITFPVVLDNDFDTWNRYQNEYWPTIYLIDANGQIVYVAIGEGDYGKTEARIQQLLQQATAAAAR